MRASLFLWAAVAGCSSTPRVPAVRFANAPVAAVVNDRLDVPRAPSDRLFMPTLYIYDGVFQRPITRALELRRQRRAIGVNALDEVPDSTWFTNRLGVREVTPDEIRRGPVTSNPGRNTPWTIHSTKVGGNSIGFIATDSRGVKYVVKFDAVGDPPELETGTDVVVNRLLWACGYNVPEDQVVYLRTSDLLVAPDASVKDLTGKRVRRLDAAEAAQILDGVLHEPDGRIRMLVSRWIDGTTVGGHPGEGVRDDDPNDRIPHELRRDLRGQVPIYAWLDAVDVTEGQYVDSWVRDAGDPTRHYLKHFAIDFGMSMGAMGVIAFDWWRSNAYRYDFREMFWQLVTVGLTNRPFQHRSAPSLRGVSPLFEVTTFDPGTWHPDYPTYRPFRTADRIDQFWGAKLIMRFTRAQLLAAVEAARFTDPRAVEYLTDMLVARQRVVGAYWFARVNPLDGFEAVATADGTALCFDDLAITNEMTRAETTSYTVATYDFAGHALGAPIHMGAALHGRSCVPEVALPPSNNGYSIVELTTSRPGFSGTTFVHVAREPNHGTPRVIGLWRQ